MLYPKLEQKLQHAKHVLRRATSENIVEVCKQYLAVLAEYRNRLYELQGTSGIRQQAVSSSSPQDIDDTRKIIRAAIETTTKERNETEMLLFSITTVSGYEAVEIFNRLKYEGRNDRELRASGVRFSGGNDHDLLTIQEAVEIAGLLRREEYVTQNQY